MGDFGVRLLEKVLPLGLSAQGKDSAMWKRFLALLGIAEHTQFIWGICDFFGLTRPINWLLYTAGGSVSGYLADMANWPPISIFLAVIGTGAGLSVVYAAWNLTRHPLIGLAPFKREQKALALEPDIDARVAFYDILANSEWASQQRPEVERPVSNWITQRLDREIHNQLRQSKLLAWGHRCLNTIAEAPEAEIPPAEWDNIEIEFAELNPQAPRTSAIRRIRGAGFNVVYAGVKFCGEQIYGQFPLIPEDTTPSPAGVQADWPIRELFFHIQPDLLDRPENAAWERIGNDLRDAFALNLVRVWGRPIKSGIGLGGDKPVLRLIDCGYWHSANFTYAFFDSTSGDAAHTSTEPNSGLPDYTDLRVNRAEALVAWRKQTS